MTEVSHSTISEQIPMHAELTGENVTSHQIPRPNDDGGSLRLGERNISGSRTPSNAGKQSSKVKHPSTSQSDDIDDIGSNEGTAQGSGLRPSVHGLTPATSLSRESSTATSIREGISLSKTKMKIWPLVRLSSLEMATSPSCGPDSVIEALKRAVDNHVTLQDHARFIDYKACMVGLTPEESLPSIVVFCDKKHKDDLKSLFHPEFLVLIHCRIPRTHLLVPWKSFSPAPPAFWLCYRFSKGPPTVRNAGSDGATVMITSEMSCCGALLEYHQRYSTVGLTVSIDGVARCITVEHVFDDQIQGELSIAEIDEDSPWTDDSENESGGDAPALGPDGDKDTIPSTVSTNDTVTEGFGRPRRPDKPNSENTRSEEPEVVCSASTTETPAPTYIRKENVHRVQEPIQLPSHLPFLDWACVEVDSEATQTWKNPGSCNVTGPGATPILLKEIAIAPSSQATAVIMISGVKGYRPGTLLRDPTYIGAPRGQEMCQAWTMIMDSQPGITPGECGSIVVHRDTYEVYGHVVGSNCMGHAHVVPLMEIISQMKTAFGTDNVQFPFQPTLPSRISRNHHPSQKASGEQKKNLSHPTSSDSGYGGSVSSFRAHTSTQEAGQATKYDSARAAAYARAHPGIAFKPFSSTDSHKSVMDSLNRLFPPGNRLDADDHNDQDVENSDHH